MTDFDLYEQGAALLHDRYRYLAPIQKGSFGKVTLALDTKTNQKVAMKAMHKSKEVEAMARHEAAVLRQLGAGNEHICQLLDTFDCHDYVVLVLEFCANGDLYDIIHSSTQGPSAVDVWNLAKELYLGLTYAHGLGIYHRDLKPENILFTETGRVKICDWGLATATRHSSVFNVGTEKYMAPECFLHTPISGNPSAVVESYDCRAADYWSFGVTVLTAIFGTSPFKPVTPNCGENRLSADGFQLKKRGVKKSLELDTNFKNFVFYNKAEVLYDIYPDMNKNCFQIFMNVLQVGGVEDDVASYHAKIQLRSLDKFIAALEANWKYGLTVWDEDAIYADAAADAHDTHDDTTHEESVFDMDDFHEPRGADRVAKSPEHGCSADTKRGDTQTSKSLSSALPLLVELLFQPKLWCDYDDDLNDAEFERLFHSLSFRSGPAGAAAKNGEIRILELELIAGSASWSDY